MNKLLLWLKTKKKLVNACYELGKKVRQAEVQDRTFRQRAFDAESLLQSEIKTAIKDMLREYDRTHGTSIHWHW